MPKRLKLDPEQLWACYLGLGDERSYSKVAEALKCHRGSVAKYALRDNWQDRLEVARAEAAERAKNAVVESIDAMNKRHLKALRALQDRAIKALETCELDRAADIIKAIAVTVDRERLIRGEPTMNQEIAITARITLEERLRELTPENRGRLREILQTELPALS